MTARIYTIPAAQVVPGMTLAGCECSASHLAATVAVDEHVVHITFTEPGLPPFDYLQTATVSITLPGPSPRELLCSCCEGNGCGDSQEVHDHRTADWRTHRHDCPVCRLRLRMWPVGATWDGVSWLFDASSLSEWAIAPGCLVQTLRPHMVASESYARWLQDVRAAFCEPEVQPCHECFDKGFVPSWVEDDRCGDGGYEGPQERYCSCVAGQRLRERE